MVLTTRSIANCLALGLALFFLAACGGEDGSNATGPGPADDVNDLGGSDVPQDDAGVREDTEVVDGDDDTEIGDEDTELRDEESEVVDGVTGGVIAYDVRMEPAAILLTPDSLTARIEVVGDDGVYDLSDPTISVTFEIDGDIEGLQVANDGSVTIPRYVSGSALIRVASIGGRAVESVPTMVVAAAPNGRAQLYRDQDLVGDATPMNPDQELSVGAQWRLQLRAAVAPEAGVILLPAEASPIAGRVVEVAAGPSAETVLVTVAYMQPHEMFEDLSLNVVLPPASIDTRTWNVPLGWEARVDEDGFIEMWPDSQQKSLGDICKVNGRLVQVQIDALRFSHVNTIELRTHWTRDHKEIVLVGFVGSTLTIGRFAAEVTAGAELKCDVPVLGVPLTAAGVLGSMLGAPQLTLGGRFSLEAAANSAAIEGKIELSYVGGIEFGFRCRSGSCELISEATDSEVEDASSASITGPAQATAVTALSGLYVVLALTSDPVFSRPRSVVEARVGVEAEMTIAPLSVQLADGGTGSFYEVSLTGRVGFGTIAGSIEAIGDWLDVEIRLPQAEFAQLLGGSPTGRLSVSGAAPRVGEATSLTVNFERTQLIGLWNLAELSVYVADRSRSVATGTSLGEQSLDCCNTSATFNWTPTQPGETVLVAFARPRIFSFLGQMRVGSVTVNVAPSGSTACDCDTIAGVCNLAAGGASDCACDTDCAGSATACGADGTCDSACGPSRPDPDCVAACSCNEYPGYCDSDCECDPDCTTGGGATPAGEGWVRIEPGTFMMGSPEGELGRSLDETQHQVTLTRAYEIMTTEVTQGMWQSLMGNNPSHFAACGVNCPVESVNWWEAVAYANAMSRAAGLPECFVLQGCTNTAGTDLRCTGVSVNSSGGNPYACTGYRLPTEAEWEFAARAGTTGATYQGELTAIYCDDSRLLSIAWFCGNADRQTHPVGVLSPNAWGLYDMLGNVNEWTWDWYGDYPGSVTDPIGPSTSWDRVRRGGGWNGYASRTRAARRSSIGPFGRYYDLGFRLARSLP